MANNGQTGSTHHFGRSGGTLQGLSSRIRGKRDVEPYVAQLTWLQEIPGVDWTLAAVIIAELGVDMKVFGNVSQLASWASVAGKRKGSRIPKGNVYLKTALVEAANAAARAKGTYLRDKFFRLKARRWYKRAAVAVAHKILVAIYDMFSDRVSYTELGDLYLDKLNKHHLIRDLVHRLERLGYAVTLEQKAA
jgi:transposase